MQLPEIHLHLDKYVVFIVNQIKMIINWMDNIIIFESYDLVGIFNVHVSLLDLATSFLLISVVFGYMFNGDDFEVVYDDEVDEQDGDDDRIC